MAAIVYILCCITSFICAGLLWRAHRRSPTRLLFWSAWCFVGLALNNVLLIVDIFVVPAVDLSIARDLVSLSSFGVLLFGLIWDSYDT